MTEVMPWRGGELGGLSACPSLLLLLLPLLVASGTAPPSHGLCHQDGIYYPNGSEWQRDACVVCRCHGGVAVCEREKCKMPSCLPPQRLIQNPQHCCPQCLPPPTPCKAGDSLFQDGEVWSPGGCEQCQCINGTVSCGRQPCNITSCPEGQVPLQLPEKCCPECVPRGRPCKVGNEVHIDGALWSPVACTHCQCRDGRPLCYIAQCPQLTCPANHTLEVDLGSCCPRCVGLPCVVDGRIFKSEGQWKKNECWECVCMAGHIFCHEQECPSLQCRPGEELYQEEGVCCPTCIKKHGWCQLKNGTHLAPGQVWSNSACDLCTCQDSKIMCSKVECGGTRCGVGEFLITIPGACCPKCVVDHSVCLVNGAFKKNGDVWKSGKCQLCSCNSGEVTCYEPSCPVCPRGMVSTTQNHSDCCPQCQPITCSSHCSVCHPGSLQPLCTVCQKGYYRQSGLCVKECGKGSFQQGFECISCHPSCSECSQATMFHCTKCRDEEVLHEGQCVSDCGRGFFASGGSCHPCHASCSECAGPESNQCQVCHEKTFLHAGTCSEACPRGYYAREQVCEECEEECEVCGMGQCLLCNPSLWTENGHCRQDCSPGFYKSQSNTCVDCHPSCKTCNDAGISSCTSCPHYLFLSGSSCLSQCPRGTYAKEGLCLPCHKSCSHCLENGQKSCTECSNAGQVVVIQGQENTTSGRCEDSCPSNHQMLGDICVAPPLGCDVWHVAEPTHCQHCQTGWKQQAHRCVKECGPGFYHHVKKNVCLECDPRCKTCSGPGHRNCLTCHKKATLHPRNAGAECLTKCHRRHYLAPDNTCRTCHPSCNVCALDHTNASTSICLRCKMGSKHREGDHCVQNCTQGHFLSHDSDACEKCHPQCATCDGPHVTSCLTCYEGRNLTAQGICEMIGCSSGFYLSPEGICSKCEGNCKTCTSDGSTCLTCHSSQHLLYGKCVDQCPPMFYVDMNTDGECQECHWTCEKCLGPSEEDCLECRADAVQEGSKCLAECSVGHYQVGQECHPCPGGCSKCNTSSVCVACHTPYLLQHGLCVTSCKSGTFANVFDNRCHECGSGCEECSLYECLHCRPPYLLQGGQCVEQCSASYITTTESGVCHYNTAGPIFQLLDPLVAEYGRLSPLNGSVLRIVDTDTSSDLLVVTLQDPPSNGDLLRMVNGSSQRLKKKSNFTVSEMNDNKIFYRHQANQSLYGKVQLSVSDGHHQAGPELISISVISLYPPEVVLNEPLLVLRGETATLGTQVLNILDLDNPGSVTIRVVDGPHHGELSVADEKVMSFSLEELTQAEVIYSHDGSNKESDLTLLQACDEQNAVNFLLQVYIVDEEQKHPILTRNLGARVEVGGRVQISPQLLQASDIDSEDGNLVFTLLPMLENSGQGKIALVIPLPPAPEGFFNDGWIQMDETHLVRPTTSFTQRDVDEGRVWYLHSGELVGGDGISDQLLFSVADSSHPPNILGDQAFIIHVEASELSFDMSPAPSTQLTATVQEGQAVTLTPSHLSVPGVGPSEHLVYTITHPLGPHHGSLFHIDSPGLELRQFMQADIDDMKIIYMPPFSDMGQDDKYFSFKFTVSDPMAGGSNRLPEQKFTFHVVPQKGTQFSFDHPDPKIVINSHETVELQSEFFELVNLAPGEEVIFILLEAPLHGTITREAQGNSYLFTEEESLDHSDIRQSRLHYKHDGSEATQDSMVFLALGHSSEASTRISITVRPHHRDHHQPFRSDNATLSVTLNEYESKAITSAHLRFTDLHSQDEDIVYTLILRPHLGSLVLTESSGAIQVLNKTNKFTQADIVQGFISYTSLTEIGPTAAEDQVTFNVSDPQNNVLSNQVLRITILSVDNSIPEVKVGSPVVVAEGGSTMIPSGSIIASDMDTPLSNLEVVLDSQPVVGYLTNKNTDLMIGSKGANPLIKFTFPALQGGSIWYIQSHHRHQEPVHDTFHFHITDGKNNSPVERLNITIKPWNDEPPVVLGEQVIVEKGNTVVIQNQSLFISDIDSGAENLVIIVEQLPQHGSLHRRKSSSDSIKQSERLVRGQHFTFQDILNELILYSHDGSKYPEDVMEILVSDGNHETGGIVEFEVVQEQSMAPKLSISSSLSLRIGQVAVISQSHLKAEDADSEDEYIKYVITNVPNSGSLEVYHLGSWVALDVGSVFLQQDIQNQHVRFVHHYDAHKTTDALRFNLMDPEGNINLDQALHITVLEDHTAPRIVTNMGLTLFEDDTVPITHHLLAATDVAMDPSKLKFSVVSGPEHGKLIVTTSPEEAVLNWNQEVLDTGNLLYHHYNDDESTSDHFVFTVSDGSNSVKDTFHITVTPVDDQLPVLATNVIKVQEGMKKVISQFELEVSDPDTHDELLVVKVTQPPQHGWLEVAGEQDAKTFTMLDLYTGTVSYVHDGSASSWDTFSVVVSDSTNALYQRAESQIATSESTVIRVEVSKVEDGTPLLRVNRGLHFLQQEAGARGKNFITSHELLVEDKDTLPEEVQMIIIAGPDHGELHLTSQEDPVSSFTQADIIAGRLYYELTSSSHLVYSDQFTFEVTNNKSSVVLENIFHIQWSWFVMGHKQYNVTETDSAVSVLVRRIGNLKQQSSVTCLTHGGSARGRAKVVDMVDFTAVSNTLLFEEGEAEKYCVVPIQDDDKFEGSEKFTVKLVEPSYALLGRPRKSLVNINDDEDKPSVTFEASHFVIRETEGFIIARLQRNGDINIAASVMCVSEDGSAIGSQPNQLANGTDFIHRLHDESSMVVFAPGITESSCTVKIIDDLVFEMNEEFFLFLKDPSPGTTLGENWRASVTIRGPNDQSTIGFSPTEYTVSESKGTVTLWLERTGMDFSHTCSVWCITRDGSYQEAQPSLDFVPHSEQVNFTEGQRTANCSIHLIDDKLNPKVEGREQFVVSLSTAQNASINSSASEAIVTLTDEEDSPLIQFGAAEVTVRENQTVVRIPVVRLGDMSQISTVRCSTRQRSAESNVDFIERPNTVESAVTFNRGVSRIECEVNLIDDLVYEKEEKFIVKLSHPDSVSSFRPHLGEDRVARVTIVDWEDRPRVSLEQGAYTTAQPTALNPSSIYRIPIIRLGDSSQVSWVNVSAKDGSAISGEDYQPLHTQVEFGPGDTRVAAEMMLLHNPRSKGPRTFTVVLGPENLTNVPLGTLTTTSVTVLPQVDGQSWILPAPPIVVSLPFYHSAGEYVNKPASPGLPLVCVSPCEASYPGSNVTKEMCAEARINVSSLQYSWEVAVPAEGGSGITPFYTLLDDTNFASSHNKVLDSMFFARHFSVRCVATPTQGDDAHGVPLRSEAVTIGTHNEVCQAVINAGSGGGLQGQSFKASLTYINASEEHHPNTIKVYVEIPHQDGMVPLVSTLPLHNVRYLLTEEVYRTHHRCSNLNHDGGFLEPLLQPSSYKDYHADRENKTLQLYQHLDMKACLWTFSAWFSMTELIDRCGGQVISDFQVGSSGQSFLTVRVPLYISRVHATSPPGWASLDHRTELSVSLYYNTLLWHRGPLTQPSLTAMIQVTRMSIDDSGRLVIDIRTQAKFRGQFVMQHPEMEQYTSRLIPPNHLETQFLLELVWSASTWEGPEQVWQATSVYSLPDYTGEYKLELVACTAPPAQAYIVSDPPACTPHPPQAFPLPLAIQQSHRPVPLVYTLNTVFQLLNAPDVFLQDPRKVDNLQEVDYKGSFGPGQTIYGRVLWHPSQDLHSAYQLYIQRVYLCTGADGYIPTYDPTGELYKEGPQYGCLKPSSKLKHRFLILDREQPNPSESDLSLPGLRAHFARDLPELGSLKQLSGVDGFLLNTDGLYQVNSGHQWYLQVLYTIGPSSERLRRETSLHSAVTSTASISSRKYIANSKRYPSSNKQLFNHSFSEKQINVHEQDKILQESMEELPAPSFLTSLHTRNGTNMRDFKLEFSSAGTSDNPLFLYILYSVVALLVLIVVAVGTLLIIKRLYKKSEKDKVIVVRSLKNEREEFRRRGETKAQERPKTLPPNMTLNSESNLQTVKVKTLAITVRNNLEDEGTEV